MNNRFVKINNNGVVYFRSEEITTPHGFSTRIGGVSKEPHLAEMNMGRNLGDDPEAVEENYRRIGAAIGFDPKSIVYTNQIHSATVLTVGKNDIGKIFDCDGFVTSEPGVTLAVRTADCVPILLYDPQAGVIGAVHAGWRGTAGKIQQEAVKKMTELSAEAQNIKAAIGACIHKCCYTVGEDFQNTLYDLLGSGLTDRYVTKEGEVLRADLAELNRELLILQGVRPENISVSPDCTCCMPDLYFSHRASKGKRGVMSAFISL